MPIHKLEPDTSLVFHVTGVKMMPGEYGESVCFVGTTKDDPDAAFNMTPASADRQLERNQLTRTTVIGRTVEFSMKKVGVKKMIDINLPAGQPDLSSAMAPAAPSPAPAKASQAKQAFSAGPALPGEDGYVAPTNAAAPADPASAQAAKRVAWERTKNCFDKCVDHALKVHTEKLAPVGIPITHEGIATTAAALFARCQEVRS